MLRRTSRRIGIAAVSAGLCASVMIALKRERGRASTSLLDLCWTKLF
jgi:hypothetical protein